jgi:hypothetical protein
MRVVVCVNAASVAALLHFEIFRNGSAHTTRLPSLGVVRPVVQLITLPFGMQLLTHAAFRWAVRVCACARSTWRKCARYCSG